MLMEVAERSRILTSVSFGLRKQYGSGKVRDMNHLVAFEEPMAKHASSFIIQPNTPGEHNVIRLLARISMSRLRELLASAAVHLLLPTL